MLLRFKYGEDLTLTPLLGQMLTQAATSLPMCDVITPMPRHASRLRERGFNQVLELGRVVAARLGGRLLHTSLERTRPTQPQAMLPASQRAANPEGSFAANGVQGKKVLLLDDIITTGATLRHAALALRTAGASEIYVAVVARTTFED